jgi:cysteine desulfurase/selenocysteine lyase
MVNYAHDFGPFDGRIWLNCAHQGPLSHVAVEAAHEALSWKIVPSHLTDDLFTAIPLQMREALGRLVNVPTDDIILGNSTSYGLHLLANGLSWRSGDEVLLVDGDYPADVIPWLDLQRRGVRIRFLHPQSLMVQAEELDNALSNATRVFCITWVNSFSGAAVDLHALGTVCRNHNVLFVVNGSQALGARPIDISQSPLDAFTSCGYKWLCGPYATGFCWIRPDIREGLDYNQAYWLTMQAGRDLNHMRDYTIRTDLGARQYDVFCPANFLDVKPWLASVKYLLTQGIEQIAIYDDRLVTHLIEGLDPDHYSLLSPREGPERSTLVLVTHRIPERNPAIYTALQRAGIDLSLREGQLRFSPHLYNTEDEIDHVLQILMAM